MDEVGPVDYAVIAFPGNQFRGEIAPALADLVEAGTIRLIDAAFVGKDETGQIFTLEITELSPEIQAGLASMNIDVQGLLSDEDMLAVGDQLEPNSSAALLVWENLWANRVAQAMRDAGGILVAFDRIPHDIVQAAREWVLAESAATGTE
jgi:uncharacterized membrane protein